MTSLKKQIQDNFKRLEELKRQIGIRPRMNVVKGGSEIARNTFDLRSMNLHLVAR